MNSIQEINRINQRELELGVAGKGSWHDQYKDSAYVFVGGLAYELTEGDVITIFSQWGEIADINLPRDKVTGKTKGFGFIMYEDQRSTVMAVDNMNGASVLHRTVRYNQPGTKNEEGEYIEPDAPSYNALPPAIEASDSGSSASEQEDTLDGEDPMAAFLRAEKKKSRVKGSKEKKRKRDEESKEERRARKEAKREKKAKKERLRIKDEPGRGRNGHERVKVERDDRDGGERDLRERGEDRVGRADRDDWREGKWEMEREEKRGKAGNGDGRDKEKDGRERERSRSRENGRFQMDGGDRYDDRDSVIRRRRDEDRYDRRRQD